MRQKLAWRGQRKARCWRCLRSVLEPHLVALLVELVAGHGCLQTPQPLPLEQQPCPLSLFIGLACCIHYTVLLVL